MKQKYDIIYSIGRDCACALFLKEAGLRITSGPFDWLTNASFETRFDLMLNDFDGFFDKQDFAFLPKDPKVHNDATHDYYENKKTGFYYYHDFPAGGDFDTDFPIVSEKYKRRIKRFYENIRTKDRVLLVWLSHYHDTPNDVIKQYCDKLCKKMGKNIDFVIIEHLENQRQILKQEIAPNIVKYRLHTVEKDGEGNYKTTGNKQDIKPIFKQYGINYKLGTRIKKGFYYVLSKTICPFIFNKKLKARVKNFLRK